MIVCKLFVLDRNTWYYITVYKKNNYAKKHKYELDMPLKSIEQKDKIVSDIYYFTHHWI